MRRDSETLSNTEYIYVIYVLMSLKKRGDEQKQGLTRTKGQSGKGKSVEGLGTGCHHRYNSCDKTTSK